MRSRLMRRSTAHGDEELGLEVQKAIAPVVTVEAEADFKFGFMVGSVLELRFGGRQFELSAANL